MALFIPTAAVPQQTISPVLNGQSTTLNIYQLNDEGLFMDVYLNNSNIISCRICQNYNVIIGYSYLGYSGDFLWWDQQGIEDPYYTGIGPGGRFGLWYFASYELAPSKI